MNLVGGFRRLWRLVPALVLVAALLLALKAQIDGHSDQAIGWLFVSGLLAMATMGNWAPDLWP